ncbi:MAG TPA: flagellar biosynthetic protein FliR [Steroidobacteraceae bacterium]|nr:flagellar biosynthetic protein FliR [Steroidobacteraceae bacterium]
MINLDTDQLQHWLLQLFWPFVRIGACFMVAPVFGAAMVPGRVRVILAATVAALVAPLLPPLPQVAPLSGAGLLITVQQVLVGAALGFCLQLTFDAVTLGGQMLANSMGLSFAFNLDPQRGGSASTPALGQLFTLLVTLTFLALDGHLTLVRTLVQSFTSLPVDATGFGNPGLQTVVLWGSQLFANALAIALPGITALLIVHLAFGVVSRAAPALNLFAVGLPVSLLCGLVVVMAGLLAVQSTFVDSLDHAFRMLGALVGARG